MRASPSSRLSRRLWLDRVTRRGVTLGGIAIIGSILAILVVIALEAVPLFSQTTTGQPRALPTGGEAVPLGVGVDEYREVGYAVSPSGVRFVSLLDSRPLPARDLLADLEGVTATGVSALGRGPFALGLADGRFLPVTVAFDVEYGEDSRTVSPHPRAEDPLTLYEPPRPVTLLAYVETDDGPVAAAPAGPAEVVLLRVEETEALIGPSTREEFRQTVPVPTEGTISALAIDNRGDFLFVGTTAGEVIFLNLGEDPPELGGATRVTADPGTGATNLGFLLGDRTLIVGDAAGAVHSWQLIRRDGKEHLEKIHDFAPHGGPVVAFAPSPRDKGFLTADAGGTVLVHYGTTGRTLITLDEAGAGLQALAFAPKADGIAAIDGTGRLTHWTLENSYPEITGESLFGKIIYEGYAEPEYVWQSTGGTDDFEAKFSLTPLIFGTLKGTLYAMLFAVPMALLGALYTSQFMHPTLRGIVKPTVEIMAALPSVVLGFIAGLWLAPFAERVAVGLFLLPIVFPVLILLGLGAWRLVPTTLRGRVRAGGELLIIIPIVLIGSWVGIKLGHGVEAWFLGGDYRAWLVEALGLTYDQRNSLVVGIAMGFAVIPIIFTIAEDALSSVPSHLSAASLALGATRWQTAVRTVLPTASPGIFSAVMIGFGRAVGETMIVLMATGNTPVMEWSIFNGFRALSANIAVELPEAPFGSTHYRVLFLAAGLLFVMTFLLNTVAELIRLRLRRKYRYL